MASTIQRVGAKLYETWLDIHYAHTLNEDFLHDLEIEIKVMRKHRNKTKRSLAQAAEAYRKVYGREPTMKT